jgi:NADH:quinone reductase (non-electrogenic)
MVQPKTQVLVIGAGYAGMLATIRLSMKTRDQNVQITLINPTDIFVERPRLHQYATNQSVRRQPIVEILRDTQAHFIKGMGTAIDIKRKEVTVQTDANPQRLAYDYLLYTAGSTFDQDSIPGIREHTYMLTPTGPHSAEALKRLLPELNKQGGRLLIIGGGPTGIESASEFAESYSDLNVSLVTQGTPGGLWGGRIRTHIEATLKRLRVTVQDQTTVKRIERNQVITSTGESIPFDLCLWAGGFVAASLAKESGLAVNEHGQLLIDLYMRSISSPFIYAAGDGSQPVKSSGLHIRMAAYTATITGAHAADCLYNAIHGIQPKPLSFAYLGQGIALGSRDAVAFNNFPDDKTKWPTLTGEAAVYGREFFVNLLGNFPNIERRVPGLHFWLPGDNQIPVARIGPRKEQHESTSN